jgi:predicted metalloprotease with PDZ domain
VRAFLLLALGSSLCAGCAAPDTARGDAPRLPDLRAEYLVRVADPGAGLVAVDLDLAGLPAEPGPLTLVMAERYAFVRLEEPLLAGPVRAFAVDGTELVVEREGPFQWKVERGSREALRVSYAVPQDHREIPEVRERDAYEFPYLDEEHGMLVGGATFLAPRVEGGRCRVRFELPDGWPVRCPWPEVEPGLFEPTPSSALQNDLVALGHWEEQLVEAGGCEIAVVVAPRQEGLIEASGPPIERIVRAEIELFGRRPRAKYLFLFGRPDPPLAPGERGMSLAGSPKNGSMTLMVRGHVDPRGMLGHIGHLIAHEFYHTWTNPGFRAPDELRFIGEGFTDYYAYLVLAREGLSTWEELAATIRGKLAAYAGNPARHEISLLEAGGKVFFEGGGAHDLVYDGGLLYAALLDRDIRMQGEGRSLDDAMRAFNNDPRWRSGERDPTVEDVFTMLAGFLPQERVRHYRELAERRGEIDFPAELRATGLEIRAERKAVEPRLRANLDGTRIRDIDPRGLGGRLGLRAGDRLLVVNGNACASQDQVRRAWRSPQDGRVRFTFERAGETHEVDEPLPVELEVEMAAEPWRAHLPTGETR